MAQVAALHSRGRGGLRLSAQENPGHPGTTVRDCICPGAKLLESCRSVRRSHQKRDRLYLEFRSQADKWGIFFPFLIDPLAGRDCRRRRYTVVHAPFYHHTDRGRISGGKIEMTLDSRSELRLIRQTGGAANGGYCSSQMVANGNDFVRLLRVDSVDATAYERKPADEIDTTVRRSTVSRAEFLSSGPATRGNNVSHIARLICTGTREGTLRSL